MSAPLASASPSTHRTSPPLPDESWIEALPPAAKPMILPRPWNKRGHNDAGWLRTFHTFSFDTYHDARHMSFSDLRVINEDIVAKGAGFPPHPHANYEIFSYVVKGELEHKDSLGNTETVKRGGVQFTSAGKGVTHSEYNGSKLKPVHFVQIWVAPDVFNIPPQYYTVHTPDALRRDRLHTVVKPRTTFPPDQLPGDKLLPAGQAIPIHASLVFRCALLSSGASTSHPIGLDSPAWGKKGTGRWVYVHLVASGGYKDPRKPAPLAMQGARLLLLGPQEDTLLVEGDGCYIKNVKVGERLAFQSVGTRDAEVLVFDLQAPKSRK